MPDEEVQRVAVTDIRMDFGSMVVFMVKWALATLPALILLWLIGLLLYWGLALLTGSPPGVLT